MIHSVHISHESVIRNGRATWERRSARGSPKLAQSQQQAGLTSRQREVCDTAFAESSKGGVCIKRPPARLRVAIYSTVNQ